MFLRRKGKIKLKKLHFEVQIHLKLLINFFDWVPILKHIHAWSEWIALMTWCPTQRFHISLSITLLKNWRFPILGKYIIRVKNWPLVILNVLQGIWIELPYVLIWYLSCADCDILQSLTWCWHNDPFPVAYVYYLMYSVYLYTFLSFLIYLYCWYTLIIISNSRINVAFIS